MPKPEHLRAIRKEVEGVLHALTESALVSEFRYSSTMPTVQGQFWEYELNFAYGEDDYLQLKCGCFTGTGTNLNSTLNVALFFENNDRLLDEFANSVDAGAFDSLLPLLRTASSLCGDEYSGASITVRAHVNSSDQWAREVCEELILILHVNEDHGRTLDIDCMQSERYCIQVPLDKGATQLRVPYDKINRFADAVRMDGPSGSMYREYQVALSFAGEDRKYVAQVARHLQEMNLRIFYDDYENVDLWGKDLYVHLDDVYRKKAQYCVVFLSQHYARKLWTNHERESAQARAFQEHTEYVLPVKLDNTEVPGIRPTTGYLGRLPPKRLAEAIKSKVFGQRRA